MTQRIFFIIVVVVLGAMLLTELNEQRSVRNSSWAWLYDTQTAAGQLFVAASDGSIPDMEAAVRHGADVNMRCSFGWTPLMLAAQLHQESAVRCLIQHGAQVNAKTSCGTTPLIIAARVGDQTIVRDLLGAGAEIRAADADGRNALIAAAECPTGDQVIRDLLHRGLDPDFADKQGQTPLMQAAECDNRAAASALLAGGANVRAKNRMNQTAIDEARQAGNNAMVNLLASH